MVRVSGVAGANAPSRQVRRCGGRERPSFFRVIQHLNHRGASGSGRVEALLNEFADALGIGKRPLPEEHIYLGINQH